MRRMMIGEPCRSRFYGYIAFRNMESKTTYYQNKTGSTWFLANADAQAGLRLVNTIHTSYLPYRRSTNVRKTNVRRTQTWHSGSSGRLLQIPTESWSLARSTAFFASSACVLLSRTSSQDFIYPLMVYSILHMDTPEHLGFWLINPPSRPIIQAEIWFDSGPLLEIPQRDADVLTTTDVNTVLTVQQASLLVLGCLAFYPVLFWKNDEKVICCENPLICFFPSSFFAINFLKSFADEQEPLYNTNLEPYMAPNSSNILPTSPYVTVINYPNVTKEMAGTFSCRPYTFVDDFLTTTVNLLVDTYPSKWRDFPNLLQLIVRGGYIAQIVLWKCDIKFTQTDFSKFR